MKETPQKRWVSKSVTTKKRKISSSEREDKQKKDTKTIQIDKYEKINKMATNTLEYSHQVELV